MILNMIFNECCKNIVLFSIYAIMQASYAEIMHYCMVYFTGICCIYSTLQPQVSSCININSLIMQPQIEKLNYPYKSIGVTFHNKVYTAITYLWL